jgi:hypothetical protein
MTEKLESDTLQEAYYDRNLAVMVLARLAGLLDLTYGIKENPDDPEWPILYVELPDIAGPIVRQVSWHIPKEEIIGEWPIYRKEWDGHSLERKHYRMRNYLGRWEK